MISEKSKELCFYNEANFGFDVGVREQTDSKDVN